MTIILPIVYIIATTKEKRGFGLRRLLFGLGVLLLLIVPFVSSAQDTGSRAILAYLKEHRPDVQVHSPEYRALLADVIWGNIPELKGNTLAREHAAVYLNPPVPQWMVEAMAEHSTTMSIPQYSVPGAIGYALQWAEPWGYKRNPMYPDFGRDDCANFISQALFEGGGIPKMGSGTCKHEETGQKWYINKSSWWCIGSYRDWAWSTSWTVPPWLQFYFVNHTQWARSADYYNHQLDRSYLRREAQPGDVVLFVTAGGSPYHAAIVTQQDANDIYLTYHSAGDGNDRRNFGLEDLQGSLGTNDYFRLLKMFR